MIEYNAGPMFPGCRSALVGTAFCPHCGTERLLFELTIYPEAEPIDWTANADTVALASTHYVLAHMTPPRRLLLGMVGTEHRWSPSGPDVAQLRQLPSLHVIEVRGPE